MAERALVTEEVEQAKRLVSFLDANGFSVKAALWLYESDAERWRFIVSLAKPRDDIYALHYDIAKAFNEKGLDQGLLELGRVSLVDADRSIVAPLTKGLKGVDAAGRRLINEQVNGIFVEDALILRLPA